MTRLRSAGIGVVCLVAACASQGSRRGTTPPVESLKSLPAVSVHDVPRAVVPGARAPSSGVAPPPADAAPVEKSPRAVSMDAFAEGDRIGDLAALALDDQLLLAWVTYVDPGAAAPLPKVVEKRSDRRRSKGAASPPPSAVPGTTTVMVRALDGKREPLAQPTVISTKADSIGGVALAEGSNRGEVGLAWVGKDAGVSQVFLTRLSRTGDKQTQRMVTHSKNGCSDVALARLGDGWIVGWVEQEGGTASVNVARVGRDFQRDGADHRVAESKGEASQLRLLSKGDEIVIAWSETRSDDALSGVYAARLTPSLAVRGDPTRIALTPGHSRGLRVASLAEGLVFAWVEGAERPAAAGPQRTVVLAHVDGAIKSSAEPLRVSTTADPSSLALTCEARLCRVVVPGADQGELALYAFGYDGTRATGTPARLAAIAGVSTEDISPTLVGNWLFFAEDNLHGRGRIRKAEIAWR